MNDQELTRRAVLAGRIIESPANAGGDFMHVSSAVVSVLPRHRDEISRALSALEGVEVRHQSESKIVVVMEARTSGALGSRLAEISGWSGVLSANMVFEQADEPATPGE